MNGKRIYNLAPGVSPNDAVTVAQGLGNVTAANAAAQAAANSANAALDAEFQARVYKDSAISSAITAANEADEAGTSASNAGNSATAAASSATAAASSANAALAGSAAVTLVSNSTTVGAINLDNPGGATRSFTQRTGAGYAGVILNSPNGYQATTYYLNLSNCFVATGLSSGNPGFQYDAGDFIDYNRASNVFRVVVGGAEKFAVTPDSVYNFTQVAVHQFAGPLYARHSNTSAPANQKLWQQEHNDSFKLSYTLNDTNTVAAVYDRIVRNGTAVVSRSLNESSGRLLVGQGITDDGASALQTTSYSASNQPGLIGSGVLQNITTPTTLQIALPALKGGVTLQGGSTAITAPVAGTYMLLASVFCIAPIVNANPYLEIVKNGVLLVRQGAIQMSGNNTPYSLPLVLAIAMLPGDYVSVRIGTPNNAPIDARLDSVSFTKLN
jgi:hypothetical protein